ncbi:hypothetical protein K523DRAFT_35837, partial [Schizophyllum commune Tattone D]
MYEELGTNFEEKLLQVASRYVHGEENDEDATSALAFDVEVITGPEERIDISYATSRSFSVLVGLDDSEVLESMSCEESWYNPDYPQYHYSDNGLL